MSWPRLALAALALALLAGCGFRPMYARDAGPQPDVVRMLHAVAIPMVRPASGADARLAQMLRNELLDRVSPRGEPADAAYRLEVVLTSDTGELLVRRDRTISRMRLSTTAQYRLMQGETVLDSGSARALTSYSLPPEGYFASVVSARDAEQNAAAMMAEQIAAALSAHFARHGAGPARR